MTRTGHAPAGTDGAGRDAMDAARAIAEHVDRLSSVLWKEIDTIAGLVERALTPGPTRRADLGIEDHCRRLITESAGRIAGAGFVAAPDVLADAPYWLEWWLADETDDVPTTRRLAAETDPTAIGFRDYTELPWYTTPLTTGLRHVTGPFVDYLCTDQHTLTFTRPIHRDGAFAGVVGTDVLAAWIDRELAADLARCPTPCVLVNAHGRVVIASEPDWVVGDLVRGLPLREWFADDPASRVSAPTAISDGNTTWHFARCRTVPLGVIQQPVPDPHDNP